MSNKAKYAIVALVLIVIIAGVAYFALNDNDDDDESEPTGDTYYLFLDGISEDKIGWYTGVGSTPEEGYIDALDNSKIPYKMSAEGYLNSLDGKKSEGSMGFGIYGNSTVDLSVPAAYTFLAGPVLTHVYSNVAYVTYSEWSWSEKAGMQFKLNPSNTTAEEFLTGGPFADKDYKPLDYGDTYSVFIDGMGDLNGWYTGTGENAIVALDAALTEKKIAHDFNVETGTINSIGGNKGNANVGYGIFTYLNDEVAKENAYCFVAGPPMDDITGNIAYVTFSEWSWTTEAGLVYSVNPSNTTTEGFLTGGPFAEA